MPRGSRMSLTTAGSPRATCTASGKKTALESSSLGDPFKDGNGRAWREIRCGARHQSVSRQRKTQVADASSAIGASVSAERKRGCRFATATTVALACETATKSVGAWQRSVPSGRGLGTCCRWHSQVIGQRQGEPSKARRISPAGRLASLDATEDRQQPQRRFLPVNVRPASRAAFPAL